MKVYNHLFGQVPNTIAPTVPVRYWNTACLATVAVFIATYVTLGALGHALIPSTQTLAYELHTSFRAGLNLLSIGVLFHNEANVFREIVANTASQIGRWVLTWTCSLSLSCVTAVYSLKPKTNTWVIKGGRVHIEDAPSYARMVSKQFCKKEISRTIHPDLMLPTEQWFRHVLIQGAVGVGKTQILVHIIRQIVHSRNEKMFLYDVKGDFCAYEDFSASELDTKGTTTVYPRPIIVSPYDQRSYVWDIGCDVHTPIQVDEFVKCFIPDESGGNNKFFTSAARMVFSGALRVLIAKHGKKWGFPELRDQKNKTAAEMGPEIFKSYRAAFPLVENADSNTTSSVMQTVMAFTTSIDYMAAAWPKVGKRRFAVTEWIRDDYKGRKLVIVQGGGLEALTAAYISAMVNIAVQEIISPSFPENKELTKKGKKPRSINFIFDELSTAGRINFMPLILQGRSKGVCFIGAVQLLSFLEKYYPPNEIKALPTVIGTNIVCQMGAGPERKAAAELFSTNLMASKDHNPTSNVHTEGKAVVHEEQLTQALGAFGSADGFEIRAIVRMNKADPMLLRWPGLDLPTKRPGQVLADWATRAAADPTAAYEAFEKINAVPIAPRPKGLSSAQIDQLFG